MVMLIQPVGAWTRMFEIPWQRDGGAFEGAFPVALFNAHPSIVGAPSRRLQKM